MVIAVYFISLTNDAGDTCVTNHLKLQIGTIRTVQK